MKEKIYNFFTNKIFIIALLFFSILFSFASSCFAVDFSVNDTLYTLNDEVGSLPYILIVYSDTRGTFYIFASYTEIFVEPSESIGSVDTVYFKQFSNSNISNCSEYGLSSYDTCRSFSGWTSNPEYIIYSNYNVKSSYGDVVFQGAPAQGEQQQGETQGIQTLTLEQAEQIPQAMTQTLQVVIPIGLVVFGIGLVIFLVRYLILRLT